MAKPRIHPPKDAAQTIEHLTAQGYSQVGLARHFGVARQTLMRWLDESDSLQEAFDTGRESERIMLHQSVVAAAKAGKPANVNAFFLLKARHGYRENDPQNLNVDVKVASVMMVRDHGTDDEWAEKAAAQQKVLVSSSNRPQATPAMPNQSAGALPSGSADALPPSPDGAPAWGRQN